MLPAKVVMSQCLMLRVYGMVMTDDERTWKATMDGHPTRIALIVDT